MRFHTGYGQLDRPTSCHDLQGAVMRNGRHLPVQCNTLSSLPDNAAGWLAAAFQPWTLLISRNQTLVSVRPQHSELVSCLGIWGLIFYLFYSLVGHLSILCPEGAQPGKTLHLRSHVSDQIFRTELLVPAVCGHSDSTEDRNQTIKGFMSASTKLKEAEMGH